MKTKKAKWKLITLSVHQCSHIVMAHIHFGNLLLSCSFDSLRMCTKGKITKSALIISKSMTALKLLKSKNVVYMYSR